MEVFEYLAALVSVVAGLSLTRALSGFANRIFHRVFAYAWLAISALWVVTTLVAL